MQKSQEKSRRGVYYNLENTPFTECIFGKTYKFSSNKKREMFNKRLNIAFQSLEKLQGRLFRICGENLEKCYNLSLLYERACDKVYSDMLYK